MTTAQLLAKRTDELAADLGITEQQAGMTTAQKLADMAIRFARLNSAAAREAAAKCLQMKAMAEKLA
jgi:hypothetical protein